MSRYFVEERRFDGGWSPAVYYGRPPTESKAEGRRVMRAAPRKVATCYYHLPLRALVELYSPDGAFSALTKEEDEKRAAEGDNAPAAGASDVRHSAPAETPVPTGAAPAGAARTPYAESAGATEGGDDA